MADICSTVETVSPELAVEMFTFWLSVVVVTAAAVVVEGDVWKIDMLKRSLALPGLLGEPSLSSSSSSPAVNFRSGEIRPKRSTLISLRTGRLGDCPPLVVVVVVVGGGGVDS